MNTPNKLTLLRVILVPLVVVFLLIDAIPYHNLWALLLFVVACITDAVDGHLARKNNLITDFGKFLDPLADKVLVISILICFVSLGWTSAAVLIIIVAREFLVSGIRLVAVENGTVIAASIWGKIKTAFTMISVIAILVFQSAFQLFPAVFSESVQMILMYVGEGMMIISAILTVISGVEYIYSNRHAINSNK
ncbi:MAG: CDP-diacylglycerol--glycerol-3-phosphate 3-phosphatidyltransferase [Oscillospiraceae bacterium]|nr:CDP-diacylglycerol--glycerol-3-phosphate 3-phosphatidyltransferase [Oscillospiraceae bacterium]